MESAEAVAASLGSRRNVTIEIVNLTNNKCLINPKVHLESGNVHVPPTPVVIPMKAEICNFSKTGGSATGAVGVLTYDILEKDKKDNKDMVAIMFSIPYSYTFHKNWFAVGIFCKGTECNADLFNKMYNDKDEIKFIRAEANGSGITYTGQHLDVLATMCPMGRAIMKVEIWEKLFKPNQSRH